MKACDSTPVVLRRAAAARRIFQRLAADAGGLGMLALSVGGGVEDSCAVLVLTEGAVCGSGGLRSSQAASDNVAAQSAKADTAVRSLLERGGMAGVSRLANEARAAMHVPVAEGEFHRRRSPLISGLRLQRIRRCAGNGLPTRPSMLM